MRITVCLLVAAFIACCSAGSVRKGFLEDLENLKEMMRSRKTTNDFEDLMEDIPIHLRTRLTAFISEKGRRRYMRCADNVVNRKNIDELDEAALFPPKKVQNAISGLQKNYQHEVENYDVAMQTIIDVLITCDPKANKKGRGEKNDGSIPDILKLRKQAIATEKLLQMNQKAPANVAWMLLNQITSLSGADRVEIVECQKKNEYKLEQHLLEDYAEYKTAKVLRAINKLPSAAYSALGEYISTLYFIVDDMLMCPTP